MSLRLNPDDLSGTSFVRKNGKINARVEDIAGRSAETLACIMIH